MTTPKFSTQAEFARLQGWARSYVTRLKQDGRIVLDGAGRVDVEASRTRIAETADPNRDAVAQHHASQRASVSEQDGDEKDEGAGPSDYQKSRALKEKYLALQAKADYERAIAQLIPRADVEAALGDVVALARAGLENLPHRIAAELVGKDLDAIRAQLRNAVIDLMDDMHRDAQRQLGDLLQPEVA